MSRKPNKWHVFVDEERKKNKGKLDFHKLAEEYRDIAEQCNRKEKAVKEEQRRLTELRITKLTTVMRGRGLKYLDLDFHFQ